MTNIIKTFLSVPGLEITKSHHKESNHAAFFITKEDFNQIKPNFIETRNGFDKEKYAKVFRAGNSILIRFKREETIHTDVIYMKIMKETSKKGHQYLKVDFQNCYDNQTANHSLLISKTNELTKKDVKDFLCKIDAYECKSTDKLFLSIIIKNK